ncbi:MAG: mazG [Solirubrobacterales bacterium]|nr:mazG [Solirubrobacterales bacterium]
MVSDPAAAGAAVQSLDELTRRLRRECPWDREQDERSIVPHTLEEAYELADAVHAGDDAKLLDELGDVLFQVHFLALLLEERGAGSMADVAEHARQKLIRRHPHIFGDAQVENAAEVLQRWDAIKQTEAGREPGIFGEVPENLPAPLYARKVQRRAASSGLDVTDVPYEVVQSSLAALQAVDSDREAGFTALGDLLFAVVNVARKLKLDPELSLRASAGRFRGHVQDAEALAGAEGLVWAELSEDQKLQCYARALIQSGAPPKPDTQARTEPKGSSSP